MRPDSTVARQKEILRLEVAVGDALRVSGAESGGDLLRVLERFAWNHRAVLQHIAKRAAVEQFHHRVRAVPLDAKIEDSQDVSKLIPKLIE